METSDLVLIQRFCSVKQIDVSLIFQLEEKGITEVIYVADEAFFPLSHLLKVEKIIQLHIDLAIEVEALEIIHRLMEENEALKTENKRLARFIQLAD